MPLEHAFQHDAGERGLLALRMADHLLDVKTRPAGCGDRIAAEAEGMHADRKPHLFRRLIDRPVAALPERLDIAAEQQHLHEILVAGALADFGGRGRTVLVGDHDRAFQARILAGPFVDLPVVDGARQSRAQILVAQALPGVERIQYAERDVVGIEMLLLHERQRRALRTAFRRIGVAARRVGLRLGIGRAFHHALIGMLAIGFEMRVPAFCQIGVELGRGGARRVDVAIGDRGLDASRCSLLGAGAELHVHCVISCVAALFRRV